MKEKYLQQLGEKEMVECLGTAISMAWWNGIFRSPLCRDAFSSTSDGGISIGKDESVIIWLML